MNIFVLDKDINRCAEYHCDKHVIKMILESAQMLSSVVRLTTNFDVGYRITHKNHPCTKWCRESMSNWIWLKNLVIALNDEYKYRYNKTVNHKSFDMVMSLPNPFLTDNGLTPFAMAMPDEYKSEDAVMSYRNYYINEKRHISKWTKRDIPEWWK